MHIEFTGPDGFLQSPLVEKLTRHGNGAEDGTAVRVVAEHAVVVRPIQVTKLDRVLSLYPTLAEALQDRSDS